MAEFIFWPIVIIGAGIIASGAFFDHLYDGHKVWGRAEHDQTPMQQKMIWYFNNTDLHTLGPSQRVMNVARPEGWNLGIDDPTTVLFTRGDGEEVRGILTTSDPVVGKGGVMHGEFQAPFAVPALTEPLQGTWVSVPESHKDEKAGVYFAQLHEMVADVEE